MALLRDELFHPVIEDNVSSADLVQQLACIAAKAFLEELRDPKKATYMYHHQVLNFHMSIVQRKLKMICSEKWQQTIVLRAPLLV